MSSGGILDTTLHVVKETINWLSNPPIFFTLSTVGYFALFYYYRRWTKPSIMKWVFWLSVAGLLLSLLDPNFLKQASKPDNIPIWIMTYSLGLVFWIAHYRAAQNDRLLEEGKPNLEKQESDQKVYTWPDLVFSEFICSLLFFAFLIVWAIVFKAPLEEPANIGVTPNPAKAPWYFLGLQEMLVYYDPWIAGVVLPVLIIVGLVALPYIDTNPKGNGYYTIKERPFAIAGFGYGFIVLWIALIFLGTFLRGPSWNVFGPFEYWDSHKVLVLNNINLSEYFWVKLLGRGLPHNILIREWLGITLTLVSLIGIPWYLAKTKLKSFYEELGWARYNITIFLVVVMLSLPIKMYLRWWFNLKYLVAIPEYMFNI